MAVVCKSATVLPELDGAERWDEPETPRHPLIGIVHALETADAPVLVCAADMPFVTSTPAARCSRPRAAPRVVATAGGVLQPLLGLYAPRRWTILRAAPADAAVDGDRGVAAAGACRAARRGRAQHRHAGAARAEAENASA